MDENEEQVIKDVLSEHGQSWTLPSGVSAIVAQYQLTDRDETTQVPAEDDDERVRELDVFARRHNLTEDQLLHLVQRRNQELAQLMQCTLCDRYVTALVDSDEARDYGCANELCGSCFWDIHYADP